MCEFRKSQGTTNEKKKGGQNRREQRENLLQNVESMFF